MARDDWRVSIVLQSVVTREMTAGLALLSDEDVEATAVTAWAGLSDVGDAEDFVRARGRACRGARPTRWVRRARAAVESAGSVLSFARSVGVAGCALDWVRLKFRHGRWSFAPQSSKKRV